MIKSISCLCKHREVLPVILYLTGSCCYAVFRKIKYNSCKDLRCEKNTLNKLLLSED